MYMSQYIHKYNHEQDASRAVGVTEGERAPVRDLSYICTRIYVLTYMHSIFLF